MMPTTPDGESAHLEAAVDHETRLFLLGEGSSVQPLAHDRYVALARNEIVLPEFAGRRFILVDWYLRVVNGQVQDVVNETCSWLVFDAQDRLDRHAALAIHEEATPRTRLWQRCLVCGCCGGIALASCQR